MFLAEEETTKQYLFSWRSKEQLNSSFTAKSEAKWKIPLFVEQIS